MNRHSFRLLALSALLTLTATITAFAQDFQRSYQLSPGGQISIRTVSGNVDVIGYEGNAVTVTGIKEGRDRDRVEIEDRSGGNRIDVGVHYPERCNCDASVRFEVRVPRAMNFQCDSISSVSGSVRVENVTGTLRARSVSGEVTVSNVNGRVDASAVSGDVEVGNVAGTVSAKSTSGDVKVEITRLEGGDGMEFASTSGNVSVRVPENLDASVEMSVLSGSLKTDFPLQIEKPEYGPGQKAHGQLGSGSRRLKLSSVSGNVSLVR